MEAPTTTSTAKGTQSQPRLINQPLRKGMESTVVKPSGGDRYSHAISDPTSTICAPNFSLAEMPFLVRSFLQSSRKPMRAKPNVARISTQT